MKDLKTNIPIIAGLTASLLIASQTAHAATLFAANFGAGEDLSSPADLPGELNTAAVTQTGSWSNFSENLNLWGLQANGTTDNSALLMDLNSGGTTTLQGDFASAADFSTATLTFSWDFYMTRLGQAKDFTMDFYDTTDALVYGIQWSPDGATSGPVTETTDGTYTPLFNLGGAGRVGGTAVGSGLYNPANLTSITMIFDGTSVSVNGNNTGLTLPSSGIAYFQIGMNGGNEGAVYDNFSAVGTAIPEPSAAALLLISGFGLMALRRRR